jgi:hypothetical protein
MSAVGSDLCEWLGWFPFSVLALKVHCSAQGLSLNSCTGTTAAQLFFASLVELRLLVIQCVEIVDHLSNDQRSALPMDVPDEQDCAVPTGRTYCMCLCGLQFVATAVWCTACGRHQCLIGSGLRRSVSHFKAAAHVSV